MARVRRGSPLRLASSFELFGKSASIVRENIWIFGTLYFVPLLFLTHSWLWNMDATHGSTRWRILLENHSAGTNSPTLPVHSWGYFVGVSILTAFMVIALSIIVQIMTQAAALEGSEGKPVRFDSIWKTTKEVGWRMVGLYILVGLIVAVGLALFIIPGIIMLRRYVLAPYVLLDKNCTIREALDRSADISKPYSGYVYGILGVMILISATNFVPFVGGLVAFTLGMLYSVAFALRYQELKKLS